MFRPLLFTLAVLPYSAAAELTICNTTDARATVAVGFQRGGDWVSEGWWGVAPNECRDVLSRPLDGGYFYYRITSGSYDWDLDSYMFCTSNEPFEIVGDTDCESRGYARSRFSEIALEGGATSHTLTVTPFEIFAGYPDPVHDEEEFGETDEFVDTRDGSQGEPYTVSGLLSGCDVTDVGVQCELHAPPWRYVAYNADSPDPTLVESLLDLPANTPMTWIGELMTYGGSTAHVTVHHTRIEGVDPHADLRGRLQGYWTSASDPNYQLLIAGGLFEEWYNGVPSDSRMLELVDTCDGARDAGPYLIAHGFGGDETPECYGIWEASGRTLSLFPLGGTRTLDFVQ